MSWLRSRTRWMPRPRLLLLALVGLAGGAASGRAAAAQEGAAPRQYAVHPRAGYLPLEAVRRGKVKMPAALARRVTVHRDSALLQQVLLDVATQARLGLSYGEEVTRANTVVSLDVADAPAAEVLAAAVRGTQWQVLVTAAGQVTVIAAERRQTGTVAGQVTDSASHAPVASVQVAVVGTSIRALTGEDGRFTLRDVPAGPQSLQARRLGYSPATQTVEVIDGQSVTADFALAQRPSTLDQVVVAGTVVESRRREVPVPVAVLTEEQIRTPSRTRIDQLFRGDVPGIIGIEGHPTQAGSYMFVRGRASLDVANLVKIYVDGVELPSTAYFSSLDLQNVERIELLRGPQATSIYGSDASGGVLLVFTKNGVAGGPRLGGSAAIGTFSSDYANHNPTTTEDRINLSGGGQGYNYSVGGSYVSSGEWIVQGNSRQVGLNGRGTFMQGPFKFSLTSTYSNRVFGLTNPPGAAALVPIIPSYGLPNNTDYTMNNQLLGAAATYAPSERWQTTLTLGWDGLSNEGRQYRPQRATPDDTTYNLSLETYDQLTARLNSTLSLQAAPGVRSTTTAGTEFTRANAEYFGAHVYDPNTEYQTPAAGTPLVTPGRVTNDAGYFVQEVVGFGDRLFLTGAVRAEHNSNFGANESVVWAPRAGVAYVLALGPGVMLKPRASYGKSLRPPSPGQAGGGVGSLYVQRANPDLRPEIQRGYDAGFDLDVQGGRLALEATYFNQTADDLIDATTLSYPDTLGNPGVSQYQNIGQVANRGLELGLRSAVGPLSLTASYTYAKSEVKALSGGYQGDLRVGDQLLYVPQHSAGGTLALTLPSFVGRSGKGTKLELGATYIGARRSEDAFGFILCLYGLQPCVTDNPTFRDYWPTLPAFTKLRAGVTQPITAKVDAFVNVDNISNRQAGEFYAYYPSRGRTVLVGLRFGQ